MPIHQENLLKAMIGDTLGDIQTEGDKDLRLNVDRAGEVDMMHIEAIGDRWQYQYLIWSTLAYLQTDRLGQKEIYIKR